MEQLQFSDQPQPLTRHSRSTVLVILTSLGSWFPMGYNLTVLNGPESLIIKWIRVVQCSRIPRNSTDSSLWCNSTPENADDNKLLAENLTLNTLWALSSAIIVCGGLISSIFADTVISKIGLKRSLYLYGVISVVGSVACTLAPFASSFELLVFGRFVAGLAMGIITVVTPMYNSEVSSIYARGSLGTLTEILYVAGTTLASILALPVALGTDDKWQFMFGVGLIPVIVMCAILPLCPESPRRLFVIHKNKPEAEKSLIWLRGTKDVSREMMELQIEVEQIASQSQKPVNLLGLLRNQSARPTLIFCSIVALSTNFSGANCVDAYSTSILSGVGFSNLQSIHMSIGLGVTSLFSVLLCTLLIERVGRRLLLISSYLVVLFSLLMFLIFTILSEHGYAWSKYVCIACMFVFDFGFFFGLAPIPIILNSELFMQDLRSSAVGLISALEWTSHLLTTFLFPLLIAKLDVYTFVIFIVSVVVAVTYTIIRLPETKGKTIEEINEILKMRS